jgi:hypothetical protein
MGLANRTPNRIFCESPLALDGVIARAPASAICLGSMAGDPAANSRRIRQVPAGARHAQVAVAPNADSGSQIKARRPEMKGHSSSCPRRTVVTPAEHTATRREADREAG